MVRLRSGIPVVIVLTVALFGSIVGATETKPAVPTSKNKCPVCGMFVAKYPDWLTQIAFRDGTVFFFDGAKDMFKFYFNIKRYSPGRRADDITAIYVTDYYSLLPIDGFTATYVTGSDVYGPMGREMIPFARKEEAGEFKKDHKGREILLFREVTSGLVKGLD